LGAGPTLPSQPAWDHITGPRRATDQRRGLTTYGLSVTVLRCGASPGIVTLKATFTRFLRLSALRRSRLALFVARA
jgi:hypothetical protein